MQKSSSRGLRLLAGCLIFSGIGLLTAAFGLVSVEESLAAESPDTKRTARLLADFQVPLPPDGSELPRTNEGVSDRDEGGSQPTQAENDSSGSIESSSADREPRTNRERIEYTLKLLEEGARYLRQFDTYCAVFHKQERLGGDLSEVQIIELKVRHGEPFAVYMKWRNSDRGRQLLYSREYEDGDMVVKLGGFKGRLLPALRLNPHGAMAREEARHPVTQAGLLGMAEKIIGHRQLDLKQRHGTVCTRLPDQEFDGRTCWCFLFEYASPEESPDYRKSLILLDAEHHFPVLARNYTWASETEGLTPEELDKRTLVENYAFTDIDFSRPLTALDFSRDNPRYRM